MNQEEIFNLRFIKDRKIRRGKDKETDLSSPKNPWRKTDMGNHKHPTVGQVEVQTLYPPFFFWVPWVDIQQGVQSSRDRSEGKRGAKSNKKTIHRGP